jgi:hypothetical protein
VFACAQFLEKCTVIEITWSRHWKKWKSLSQIFSVCVTAVDLGRLQKQTNTHFLNSGVSTYVQKNKLLIFYSWGGGQTNPALYNEELFDENDGPTLQ